MRHAVLCEAGPLPDGRGSVMVSEPRPLGSGCRVACILFVFGVFFLAGCGKSSEEVSANTGPAPAQVEQDMDASNFKVDHPEQFPLVTAGGRMATPELGVNGVVSPDVSRQVPVPSLASGRIAEIDARKGDTVKKGDLLFKEIGRAHV